MNCPSICNVWKNGSFLTTTPVTLFSGGSDNTKSFSIGGSAGAFSLNAYFYNASFSYSPTVAPTTTDTYTFYLPLTYTMTGSSIPVPSLPGCTAGIIVKTTTEESSFTNVTYSNSSDTYGWYAYSLSDNLKLNHDWSVTGNGYVPTDSTTWTGLQECDIIYSNEQFITKNLNMKYTYDSGNKIQWIKSDYGSNGVTGSISVNPDSNSMNFTCGLVNGFTFNSAIRVSDINLLGSVNGFSSSTLNLQSGNVTVATDGKITGKSFFDTTGNNKIENTGITCNNINISNSITLPALIARASCTLNYNSGSGKYEMTNNLNFRNWPNLSGTQYTN